MNSLPWSHSELLAQIFALVLRRGCSSDAATLKIAREFVELLPRTVRRETLTRYHGLVQEAAFREGRLGCP